MEKILPERLCQSNLARRQDLFHLAQFHRVFRSVTNPSNNGVIEKASSIHEFSKKFILSNAIGPESAFSKPDMAFEHNNPHSGFAGFESGEPEVTESEAESDSPRLDFRHASNHLNQKRPGYYLILLRTELRHRSLREKPTLIG